MASPDSKSSRTSPVTGEPSTNAGAVLLCSASPRTDKVAQGLPDLFKRSNVNSFNSGDGGGVCSGRLARLAEGESGRNGFLVDCERVGGKYAIERASRRWVQGALIRHVHGCINFTAVTAPMKIKIHNRQPLVLPTLKFSRPLCASGCLLFLLAQ